MRRKLAIILTLLCFLPLTVAAQELDLLMDRVENTIKASEPEWKLLGKVFERNVCIARWAQPSDSNPPNPYKDEYIVFIRVHPSEKKATDELQDSFLRNSSGDRGEKVSGVGQEAYLLKDGPERPVTLRFRQRNISVDLRAPSETNAMRLAELITNSIPSETSSPVLQDFSNVLESEIKSNEAAWKLSSKRFEKDGGELTISWRTIQPEMEQYVAVIRAIPSNAAAAGEIAEQRSDAAFAGVGVKIQGIGQEAYLSQPDRNGHISMLFRQGNFVVTLIAPSEAEGRRLARYIVDSIATIKLKK